MPTEARSSRSCLPDPRFYDSLEPITLGELASLTGTRLSDPSAEGRRISGVATLAFAGRQSVSFCAGGRHLGALRDTEAGACFLASSEAAFAPADCVGLVGPHPQAAYAAAADRLHSQKDHPSAGGAVHVSANLEDGVILGAGVVIGPGAAVGRGSRIGAGAVIGPGVAIGRNCRIGPGAVIGFALIGDRVLVHAGAVIGEPGFGATAGPNGVVDLPQLGRVILQDGVTVGANTCIDRGAFEDTVVGENTKIDNLVQIAHNVVIGRNCVLAAHTGISGSTVVGDGCRFGGRAGVSDHVNIGAGASIAAAAGVMKDVPAGESWGGSPARPLKRWMRDTAWVGRAAGRRPSASAQNGGDR